MQKGFVPILILVFVLVIGIVGFFAINHRPKSMLPSNFPEDRSGEFQDIKVKEKFEVFPKAANSDQVVSFTPRDMLYER